MPQYVLWVDVDTGDERLVEKNPQHGVAECVVDVERPPSPKQRRMDDVWIEEHNSVSDGSVKQEDAGKSEAMRQFEDQSIFATMIGGDGTEEVEEE